MEPAKSHCDDAGLGVPYFCPYGQFMQELMDEGSGVNRGAYRYVWLHLDAEEFLRDGFYTFPDEQKIIDSFTMLLSVSGKWAEKNPDRNMILSSLVFPPQTITNFLELNSDYSFSKIEVELGRILSNFVQSHQNVLVFNFHRIIKRFGFESLCDEKYWYLGRIKYTEIGFSAICHEFNELIRAYEGKSRKLLVCDLDNVLWGGIVGEEGPLGIDLSEEGPGKAFRDFQKTIKSLKEQGVLLAINSKNNEKDVREVFEKNRMMVLTWQDFVITKVNWDNKPVNLQQIATELNIGLDSMVMIDDSAQERLMIKEALPDIAVPEFPRNTAALKNWLINAVIYPYFGKTRLTQEDRDKDRQYKNMINRENLSKELDINEYLKSLDIQLEILKNPKDYLARISQLTQKTNQFNLTTKRYQVNQIESLVNNGRVFVYGLRYKDRFGDEGIVGAAIVTNEADNTAVLDTYLLSCRILGRNVEFQFMELILGDLVQIGIDELRAEFVPTAKNLSAEKFYSKCGFEETDSGNYRASVKKVLRKLSAMVVH